MTTTAVDKHILEILSTQRDALLEESAAIVYASGGAIIDRASTEQLLRGSLAILEETLVGTSSEQRRVYLDVVLPEVARSGASPWRNVLHDGLPCWGLLVGLISVRAHEAHRGAVVVRISRLMGAWWADVWDAMYPAYKSVGGP